MCPRQKTCLTHEPTGLAVFARWVAFVLLAGHLLFAHGCHGDEDHELFGAVSRVVGTSE
jgi:hypothetical protein